MEIDFPACTYRNASYHYCLIPIYVGFDVNTVLKQGETVIAPFMILSKSK